MLVWLFWGFVGVLGLIGVAMLVAGWELLRRHPHSPSMPLPTPVHSIDLNLADPTSPAAVRTPAEPASPPTDSDARRRALVHAIERMSEPARRAVREPWQDTEPRVNLPNMERTPPA